ncbi:MAG: hypothetical protein KVP17_001040 [Porospora cf. gigantea B]|uniref:uncharacterized protein n=1 Tax=Porospora cf. gigantea B TaxID=2853592 RepID=UPI003571F41A|nr:MAG: hypothetical protein KVP17_001040 [Porospora cf. gigantea B]
MRDKRPDLETLTDAARQHLAVSRGYHLIPENSRMLVLDSSVPFIVALRSLFDYRRPFGCVYYSGPGSFRQLFDAEVVIDILLCIWHVERSLGFRRKFLEALGADLDTELVNFNVPDAFSCGPLLDQVCTAPPSSTEPPTSGNEPMDWAESTVPAVNNGGLWLHSLAGWQRLLGNYPSFPFMSCRRTALEAAEFMLLAK